MIALCSVQVIEGDLSQSFNRVARESPLVAWDIETGGLNWSQDQIGTCQVHVPGVGTEVVRVTESAPRRLVDLLESKTTVKLFHHAAFDLRFMRYQWDCVPRNVACTKVLSKLTDPKADAGVHSLKSLLHKFFDLELDKTQQVSDWLQPELNQAQIEYAAKDVEFLPLLYKRLLEIAHSQGLFDVVERTFDYLPIRVETDIRGCGDVFSY